MEKSMEQTCQSRVIRPWSVALFILLAITGGCMAEETDFQPGQQAKVLTEEETAGKTVGSADATAVFTLEFTAGSTGSSSVTIDSGLGTVEETLSLSQLPGTREIFQQTERPLERVGFTQGYDGEISEEVFTVLEAGKLDLLIVMDNSGSMRGMQTQFAAALPNLLKFIANTNWQITVVTTDSSCLQETASGRTRITRDEFLADPDGTIAEYIDLIDVGTSGNTRERGIYHAARAMAGTCTDIFGQEQTFNWRRPLANSAVLVVTDERNCGSNVSDAERVGCTVEEERYATYFSSRNPGVPVYGLLLLNDPDPSLTMCQNSGYYDHQEPTEYIKLINESGGLYGEVCQQSYNAVLENISKDVSEQVVKTFELTHVPEAGRFTIEIDGEVLQGGYSVQDRTITIDEAAVSLDSLSMKVTYFYNAVKRMDDFPLTVLPDAGTFDITINGEKVDPADFTWDEAGHSIRFKERPADLAEISITYRHDEPLPDQFTFAGQPVADGVRVLVNDQVVDDFSIEPGSQQLLFHNPPPDGARIIMEYERPGDRRTSYGITVVAADRVEQAWIVDPDTGEHIETGLDGDQVLIPPHYVSEGASLRVVYKIMYTGTDLDFVVPLSQAPLPEGLRISSDGDEENCAHDVVISGQQLFFHCEEDDFSTITIAYDFEAAYINEFDLAEYLPDNYTLKVFVDDREISSWEDRNGRLYVPSDDLPVASRVTVLVAPR